MVTKNKFPLMAISIILIVSLLVPSFSARVQGETARYGGTLVFLMFSDASTANPLLAMDLFGGIICSQIFSQLVDRALDENGKLYYRSDLADSWEISPDGMILTFYLKENVVWHDGEPFTSADVKFTFDLFLDPDVALPTSYRYGALKSVETPNEYTVKFTLKELDPTFMSLSIGANILPKHLYEGTDIYDNPYNDEPIGTGPFKFVEWIKGDQITVVKNRDFYEEDLPYLDGIVFKIAPDTAARSAALETGEAGTTAYIPETEVSRLSDIEGLNVFRVWLVGGVIYYIGINHGTSPEGNTNPILQNKKVRQALNYAIDQQEIIDLAFLGIYDVQTSIIHHGVTDFYEPNVPKYDYNPDTANKLLDDAGYLKGDDGTRFTLRLSVWSGDAPRERASEIIKSQLAKVGINIEIFIVDWPTLKSMITEKYDYDLSWMGTSTGPDPDILYYWYHGSQISPGSWQFIRYNNTEVDVLWDQAKKEMDPDARGQLFKQIQMIVMEEAPVIPIADRYDYTAASEEYVGLNETGAFWVDNHMDRVWWTGGSLVTPDAAAAKIEEVETKLEEYEAENWRGIDEAYTILEQAKRALSEGIYDDAINLADEALEIPVSPPPYGMYAAVVAILIIAGIAVYYYITRRK